MFNESRLLDAVSYGSQFGHSYNTTINTLRSGHERRNATWSAPLGKYSVIFENLYPKDHLLVIKAHHACMGCLIGFRFKDWSDYTATMEPIGMGTGASQTYQLTKRYTFGALTTTKNITKPVSGTVHFYANKVEIFPTTFDYTTGIFTLKATSGATVYWSGEFDVPVRFSSDELMSSSNDGNSYGLFLTANVDLQEIRE